MLGAIAALAVGFLFAAPAHAVEGYITPIDVGHGVMCEPRVGGATWPANGTNAATARFFYCGSATGPTRGQDVLQSMKAVASLEPTTGTLFTTNNVKVYVMDSAIQYATSTGNDPLATYNTYKTTPAFSLFTALGAPLNGIFVFERVPDTSAGHSYPDLVAEAGNLQAHDSKHEAGHHFDRYMGMKSNTSTFLNLIPDDKANSLANNPNHAANSTAFAYWWNDPKELFAELFAIVNGSLQRPVDPVTSSYFNCTKAYVFGWARDQMNPASYPAYCTPLTP